MRITHCFTAVLVWLICSTCAWSQELLFKKRTETSIILGTTPLRVAAAWQPTVEYSLLVVAEESEGEIVRHSSIILSVETSKKNLHFEKGALLLLKTEDEEEIQLENAMTDASIHIYDWKGYNAYIPPSKHSTKNTLIVYTNRYEIPEEALDCIRKNGIKQLRIQTSADNINCLHTNEKTQLIKSYFSKAGAIVDDGLNPQLSF